MSRNIRQEFGLDYLIPDGKDASVARLCNVVQKMVDNNAGPTSTIEGTNSRILVRADDFKAVKKALEKLP